MILRRAPDAGVGSQKLDAIKSEDVQRSESAAREQVAEDGQQHA